MKDEIVEIYRWDPTTDKESLVVVDVESIIRNPGGFRMDGIGLILFNRARRELGLTEFKLNTTTGTFDEV